MSKSNKEVKLRGKEIRDLVIQSGIQGIPYIGSFLATLYFGAKQERRFKRLEEFYSEAAQEIKDLKDRIASKEQHDKDALAAIIEELNEKVEQEQVREKRKYFKTYLKNTLIYPMEGDYEERRYFLDTLSSMSLLECEVLGFLYNQDQQVRVGDIKKPSTDQYAIVGAISRLKSYGFLISSQGKFSIGSTEDNMLNENVKVSNFGRHFYDFSLKNIEASVSQRP